MATERLPKETVVEGWVRAWLRSQGFFVEKGDDVDIAAYDGSHELKHLIEVKREFRGDEAQLNAFRMALGQVFTALTRYDASIISMALPPSYRDLVKKYTDVFRKHGISVLWIKSPTEMEFDTLSTWDHQTHDERGRRKRNSKPKMVKAFIDGEMQLVSKYDPRLYADRT